MTLFARAAVLGPEPEGAIGDEEALGTEEAVSLAVVPEHISVASGRVGDAEAGIG